MSEIFKEVHDLLPNNSFVIMTAVLISTNLFLLLCSFIKSVNAPLWMSAVTAVIFATIILVCIFIKIRICIEERTIQISFLKKYVISFEEVIDHKIGDIDVIKNFSGWGINKVTFKNFISLGYDRGISLKLTGRRVITVSLSDPEGFAALLPPAEK